MYTIKHVKIEFVFNGMRPKMKNFINPPKIMLYNYNRRGIPAKDGFETDQETCLKWKSSGASFPP